MAKIGTHNSATGERGDGWLSWLGMPFARCQCKTLREQYDAGCRYFDIRAKRVVNKHYSGDAAVEGESRPFWAFRRYSWVCAHGLWTSRRTLGSILHEIDDYPEACHVILTYEGSEGDAAYERFKRNAMSWMGRYRRIDWEYVAVKKPEWKILWRKYHVAWPEQGFINVTGWRRLLPVPWLWHVIRTLRYSRRSTPTMDAQKWTLVDFL